MTVPARGSNETRSLVAQSTPRRTSSGSDAAPARTSRPPLPVGSTRWTHQAGKDVDAPGMDGGHSVPCPAGPRLSGGDAGVFDKFRRHTQRNARPYRVALRMDSVPLAVASPVQGVCRRSGFGRKQMPQTEAIACRRLATYARMAKPPDKLRRISGDA